MICVILDKIGGEGEAAPVYWRGQGQPLGTKTIIYGTMLFLKRKCDIDHLFLILLCPTHQSYDKDNEKNKDKVHVRKEVKYPFM